MDGFIASYLSPLLRLYGFSLRLDCPCHLINPIGMKQELDEAHPTAVCRKNDRSTCQLQSSKSGIGISIRVSKQPQLSVSRFPSRVGGFEKLFF